MCQPLRADGIGAEKILKEIKGHGTLLIILNQQFYKLFEISVVISKDIFRNCLKLIVICAKLDVPLINPLFMS